MHILFGGLAKYDLIDILQSIIDGVDSTRVSLNEINTKIKLFDFGRGKSRNKPSKIKDNIIDDNPSLSMTTAQTWSMVLLLPFILDEAIDVTHFDYAFFNQLRLIIQICFSNVIKLHHLDLLDETIKKYYDNYLKQNTLSNVPKLHYLCHLVETIKR